jgi:glycosyltransferase involved in cell wall biosynthesis
MGAPQLSVIVASHREEYIGGLLTALRANALDYETIAVCDYGTGRLAPEFPWVAFHTVKDRSISAKRNFGVKKAGAGVVAFIDDDCVPSPDWITKGLGSLAANPSVAAVEGLTTIETVDYTPPSLRDYRRLERPGYRTNNIFYRKDVFQEVGGFDERFTVQREDIDLAFSVLDKGYTIGFCADVRVMHRVRRNEPWDLLKNCVNRRFDPLLYKKHPSRYREHLKTPFPATLLMLLGFHCVTVLSLCIGPPFFVSAGIIDVAAVTVLTLRRCRGPSSVRFGETITEWVSCLCAPLVLLGALVFGGIRYGKLLLV